MDIQYFIREHKPVWSELEQLLEPFERSKRTVQAMQIDRLTLLYKTASAHLAFAQTYYPGDEIVPFLNQLVSRAHQALFAGQRQPAGRLADFF